MMLKDLTGHSLGELSSLIAAKEISSEQLVEVYIAQIQERDSEIGAWEYFDAELALQQARIRDAEPSRGPLHGIPVGIKDIIDTADMPTRRGSRIHADRRPAEDAYCVAQLRHRGAVIMGKTTTTEYATWTPSKTRNPRNTEHTPGGSSSGSAAAIAADMVPLALGTQTVGSTIRPAAFCGVTAMKPTFGLMPMGGVNHTSQRLDTLGLFARTPQDLEILYRELLTAESRQTPSSSRLTVLAVQTPWWDQADENSRRAFAMARDAFADLGAGVVDSALPAGFAPLPEIQDLIAHFDIANNLRMNFLEHEDEFSEDLHGRMLRGFEIPIEEYWNAMARVDSLRPAARELLAGGEVLLMPATTGIAPEGLDSTGNPLFVRSWSILGNPVVTIPVTADKATNLPIGIQLVAKHGDDVNLLGAAILLSVALANK